MSGLTILTGDTCWTAIGHAVPTLTVVRVLPVALSLIGLSLVTPRTVLVR